VSYVTKFVFCVDTPLEHPQKGLKMYDTERSRYRDRCYDLKIFSPKNLTKILAFLLKLLLVFCKKVIITLVFEKNANFFAENWQKSQKIVIITSTPDLRTFLMTPDSLFSNPFRLFCQIVSVGSAPTSCLKKYFK
jgi:hypothetical protein